MPVSSSLQEKGRHHQNGLQTLRQPPGDNPTRVREASIKRSDFVNYKQALKKAHFSLDVCRGILGTYRRNGYVLKHPFEPPQERPKRLDPHRDLLMNLLNNMKTQNAEDRVAWLHLNGVVSVSAMTLRNWYKRQGVRYIKAKYRAADQYNDAQKKDLQQ